MMYQQICMQRLEQVGHFLPSQCTLKVYKPTRFMKNGSPPIDNAANTFKRKITKEEKHFVIGIDVNGVGDTHEGK